MPAAWLLSVFILSAVSPEGPRLRAGISRQAVRTRRRGRLAVFPVALMFFLGFCLARKDVFDDAEATAILKLIARIAAPAILVSILVTSDFGAAI